jgi:N6-L-threonylcarbamoyladenine synthase
MIVLGIESTAHTFGIAILQDTCILSNVKECYHNETGGMIPSQVSDHHVNKCQEVLIRALAQANTKLSDVGLIAFSQAPGIGHALRIGATTARSLSLLLNKPLIGVNHCIAHLEIGRLTTPAKDPVLLYASGANTQIIAFEAEKYRIFGETLDIGVGNFLDSFGRLLGLGFPAGPRIEQLAQAYQGKDLIPLSYSVKGMDISFGGILTQTKKYIESGNYSSEQLCHSVQETVFSMLVEVAERALAHVHKKELVLGGGVACNKRLQLMCSLMARDRGAQSYAPSNEFLVDNAAMIAYAGLVRYKAGKTTSMQESIIHPYERTDEVVYP